jgi:hypothetical protein
MQGPFSATVYGTRTGRFKVYIEGRADDHILDWRGLNLRAIAASGQPRAGFETCDEALRFARLLERDRSRWHFETAGATVMRGSAIPRSRAVTKCHCASCKKLAWSGEAYCDGCAPPFRPGGACAAHRREATRSGANE